MIFKLITPAIAVTFALCFLAIYLYDKRKKAPAILAVSYAIGASSLTLDFFRQSFDPSTAAVMTNTLYTATLFLTTVSLAVHFRQKAPVLLMATISILQAGILMYFIYIVPDITIRTIIANLTAASLMACSLLVIDCNDKNFINRLLFWVATATALQFLLRAIFVFYMAYYQDLMLTDANYSQSVIITSLHFSIAILSLIMAVTASIAFGIDAIADIRKLADTDTLSGLLNRRGFELQANEMIGSARKNAVPLTMIVADLDNFKIINDEHGHIIGDEVIHTFGKLMRKLCRNGDIAGRLGGEEFCLLLHASDLSLGRLMAETLRRKLEHHQFETEDGVFYLTASFGVAELQKGESYNQLFARADEELYNAKNSGRNQVRPKRVNYILKSVI